MVAACTRGALALDDRLERDAPVDLVVAGHDAGEYGFGLVSRRFGEKAQPAQVDSEDWRFAFAYESRDAQQGSVAAEYDEQVGPANEFVILERACADLLCDLRRGHRFDFMRMEPA